jgi:DnaJ-class molecular chaperone
MNPIELLILSQRKARRSKCPRCGGTGLITEYWKRKGEFVPVKINCPLCGGDHADPKRSKASL